MECKLGWVTRFKDGIQNAVLPLHNCQRTGNQKLSTALYPNCDFVFTKLSKYEAEIARETDLFTLLVDTGQPRV